ncbi:MAG TPA: DJ-1/PfpI family protein [Thermoanaerobaculia bacterium]|jgi:transcriptional regulator GlxA family with amidase domain|nr:DJ-1/PfpI family protein [Thermoanaerobaculia bacterium]
MKASPAALPPRWRARGLAAAVIALSILGAGLAVALARAQGAAPPPAPPAASASTLPRVLPPADLPRDRPLRAGFLILDGVYGTELVAPYDVLQHATAHTRPGIDTFTISPEGGAVRTAEGLALQARYSFANAPALDILVVPSGDHNMDSDLGNEALVAWLAKVGKQARYVVSLCDGAFLLARAGLTQGRLVTTFPADQDRFAQMFPALELRRGVSFVHDGPLLTSVGGARSYDAALYLVDHLYGEQVAKEVAKGLVLPWPPGEDEAPLPALVIRYQEVKKK